jgi:hypothetical protein
MIHFKKFESGQTQEIFEKISVNLSVLKGRHDIQHNDNQHKNIQYKGLILDPPTNDTKHINTAIIVLRSVVMMSVTFYSFLS